MRLVNLDIWVREKEHLASLGREEIEAVQLQKLNRLLKREKARGGFYRDLPGSLEHIRQLQDLPFTTEADILRDGNRMVLVSQSGIDRVRSQETSGTTGAVKRVFYSEKDNERTVSFFAAGLSELVHPGEKTLICMPFSGYRGLGELIAEAIRRLGAQPLAGGVGRTYGELLGMLEEERPETFVGMPVPLLSLLRQKPDCSLKRALVSADACPDAVMEATEELLGSRLYPHYGSRELGLGGAVTCSAFAGMHVRENDIIAEVIGAHGEPLGAGEWGELVVTTVEADAMPLIRYRTGDRTRIFRDRCPCGSSLCRLDRLTRLGERNPMELLDEMLFRFPEVVDYRAKREGGTMRVEGYLTEPGRRFPSEWNGYRMLYSWRRPRQGDMPCYQAKRRIL